MSENRDSETVTRNGTIPDDWDDVVVDDQSDDVRVVKRIKGDGSVPPLAIEGRSRPILVEVHFGSTAIVPSPVDAVRYGYQQDGFRTEFYFLDVINEPKWIQIAEDMDDPAVSIPERVDEWVSSGELTEQQARWAKDQFE